MLKNTQFVLLNNTILIEVYQESLSMSTSLCTVEPFQVSARGI